MRDLGCEIALRDAGNWRENGDRSARTRRFTPLPVMPNVG